MHVDEVPDRLAQLYVFERSVLRGRQLFQVSRGAVNEYCPPLEKQYPRIARLALEYLTNGSVGQIDVINDFGESFYEPYTQTDPRLAADHSRRWGAAGLVIAHLLRFRYPASSEFDTNFYVYQSTTLLILAANNYISSMIG
jgi:hypothetical protein